MSFHIEADFASNNGKVKANLAVLCYVEDGIHYFYTPALDLFGYGESEEAAKASFEVTLAEFLKYTINKRTLHTELTRLGWKINKKRHKIKSPNLEELLRDNEHVQDIINKTEFRKINQDIEIPEFA